MYFLKRKLQGKPNYFWEYRFTKNELRGYLENAGFEIIHTDIDDYESEVDNRHIGLWADWFFLRQQGGEIWELNRTGQIILKILRFLPSTWYCSGLHLVARAVKEVKEDAQPGNNGAVKKTEADVAVV